MLTDVHQTVLALMRAGQELRTARKHGRTQAFIGHVEIPPQIVDDLKKEGLIKMAPVLQNYGALHGYHRWYVLARRNDP